MNSLILLELCSPKASIVRPMNRVEHIPRPVHIYKNFVWSFAPPPHMSCRTLCIGRGMRWLGNVYTGCISQRMCIRTVAGWRMTVKRRGAHISLGPTCLAFSSLVYCCENLAGEYLKVSRHLMYIKTKPEAVWQI